LKLLTIFGQYGNYEMLTGIVCYLPPHICKSGTGDDSNHVVVLHTVL